MNAIAWLRNNICELDAGLKCGTLTPGANVEANFKKKTSYYIQLTEDTDFTVLMNDCAFGDIVIDNTGGHQITVSTSGIIWLPETPLPDLSSYDYSILSFKKVGGFIVGTYIYQI